MGKNYIITIGREYGSGGFEIGKKLAEKLGIGFYDKNLIDEVSKKSGIHVEMLHKADEKTASPFTNPLGHPGYEAGTVNDRLFWTQSEIIRDLADKESCVIMGRCADFVLRDRDNVLKIFIQAPMEDRIKRICDKYLIDIPVEAKKEIQKNDKVRRTYYQFYTDGKWGARERKDLVINSSILGIDGTVDFLKAFVEQKFGLK